MQTEQQQGEAQLQHNEQRDTHEEVRQTGEDRLLGRRPSRRPRVKLVNDFKHQKCARCFQPIQHGHIIDAVYENGEWYHRRCLEEGKRQFAEARKQSRLA